MFCAYPTAQSFGMFPMMPTQSASSDAKTNPLTSTATAQLPFKAGVELPLKSDKVAKEPQLQFKMPSPLQQFQMMQQLQQLQMIQFAMQQNLAHNAAAAKSVQGWLSEPERAKQARDFVMLKRILFELSDEEHYVDIEAAEAALRERDPEIFTRTKKRTFQELVIQANKVGIPVSWLDETRSPSGKETLRLTLPATHYIHLVKVLMRLCDDDEPRGYLSGLVAGQLRLVDPGFWSRRPVYKGSQSFPSPDKTKRGTFRLRVEEVQRMGAPVKWTGEPSNYSYVGLEW